MKSEVVGSDRKQMFSFISLQVVDVVSSPLHIAKVICAIGTHTYAHPQQNDDLANFCQNVNSVKNEEGG